MKKILFTVCFLSAFFIQCQKNTEFKSADDFNYRAETVVDDLEIAWGFEFLEDGSILIAEQEGKMILYKDGERTEINNVPKVYYNNQGGLLDVKLHPDYRNNGWIYFSYSGNTENDDKGSNTVIMRARLKDNNLIDKEVIYKATPNTKRGHHFGSRIEFDNEGYLFFSVGDRGNRDVNPQDINRDGGKIYRLNDDGSIPSDNPFVSEPGSKAAVYSFGHRNPQGMALHKNTGKIWIHEHGPQGGDEINIIESGKNYGWPVITYGINYDGSEITDKTSMPGMEQPIHYWVPSIAPSGMAFINSDIYPSWKGHLLVGSLKFQYLNLVRLENNTVVSEEKLMEDLGRVRTVKIGPDGYIYVSVEQLGIVRLMPD
ncbi:PQQ-dependent sugar dehydrogenase [Lutimonas saemankumensis]|uniref:PQQ-dependent sugar dehydrogenase n=1 Tax=Lutimonas saemankumensis TaxID=483016 RepID=UPI001CD1FC47|nr:PQQ-dependent sugar dehydrogenase [Lutimonas saemankumensis]MCA0933170.1 PQQ-dependent sugar dehydrogenase [Lutimonas saemankumensis]